MNSVVIEGLAHIHACSGWKTSSCRSGM